MVRLNSPWIKFPVLLFLATSIALVFIVVPSSNTKAIGIIGLILLTEAYFLGIDTAIIKRIVKMKPLSRVINGLYYVIIGGMLLIIMALGAFTYIQWTFGVFVFLVGVTILIYHAEKGPTVASAHRDLVLKVSESVSVTDKGAGAKPVVKKPGGLKFGIKKHELYTYPISLGSDLAVTALFLAIFALIDYVTAILLFILGCIVRYIGDKIAKGVGVVKEVPLPEETAFK